MADAALLAAMVAVEQAWLDVLVETGVAPRDVRADLGPMIGPSGCVDPAALAVDSEAGGNPVIPLVRALRGALPEPAATWLHRGLTSQDVLDTAIILCARDTVRLVRAQIDTQARLLTQLADRHRGTLMVARTLTQPAVPTTFGAKAATWLEGVLDADEALAARSWPVQLGGAGGTLAALVELAGSPGAHTVRAGFARALALAPATPWHTRRAPITALGDAAVTATDAWGHIANDILTLARPEIGELRDTSAGASSAMPQKANPTLAVLVRRAALSAPQLAATLHLAAAEQVDERADGGWHAEWATLASLLRRTAVAAAQTTALVTGLQVDSARMRERLDVMLDDVTAEQRAIAAVAGKDPAGSYLGLADDLIDDALARARRRPAAPQEKP